MAKCGRCGRPYIPAQSLDQICEHCPQRLPGFWRMDNNNGTSGITAPRLAATRASRLTAASRLAAATRPSAAMASRPAAATHRVQQQQRPASSTNNSTMSSTNSSTNSGTESSSNNGTMSSKNKGQSGSEKF